MNVQDYIASGILQEYCLGLLTEEEKAVVDRNCHLYPEINKALETCQAAIPHPVPGPLKETIWNLLENINREEKGLEGLPVLNKFSERDTWLQMVQPLIPVTLDHDQFIKVIREDPHCTQLVLWSKIDIPEEEHDDVQESFMVLEGACECYVGDEIFRLGPGGYLEIPMHMPHSVKILSSTVLAVVQRVHKNLA